MSSIREGKRLKKVRNAKNRSTPMVRAGLDKQDIEAYLSDVQDTYVEEWEPLLGNGLTFRTVHLPMEKKHAQAMVAAYEQYKKLTDASSQFEAMYGQLCKDPLFAAMERELQDKMDACMKDWGCEKVFVKGSSRSAKDAVNLIPTMSIDFESRCIAAAGRAGAGSDCKCSLNDGVVALLGAGKDAMGSPSARYFLRLFVRSERIYQDMTLALGRPEFKSGWAIREWCDVDIGMEFRGFVCKRELCALSQYDYLVTIDRLLDCKSRERIVSMVQDFYAKSVAPKLHQKGSKFESYVVDFAVDVKGRCWVIELNPFQESTDGALFSWARESKLLKERPFTFRFQDKPQNAKVALSIEWRKLLERTLERVNSAVTVRKLLQDTKTEAYDKDIEAALGVTNLDRCSTLPLLRRSRDDVIEMLRKVGFKSGHVVRFLRDWDRLKAGLLN